MTDFAFLSLEALYRSYREGRTDPVAVTEWALDRIAALEPVLNMFATLDAEGARAAASESAARWAQGTPRGLLDGIPTSIKDLIAMRHLPTQFGSKSAAGNIIDVDAPAVARLKAAGAVILGKSTTSEFGCKAVGDSPLYGITRNPWNTDMTPGGSSCGAAAMVAAGIVPFAIGTDGGGSLRIPAALSGLVGMKATFGRVPVAPTSATPTLAHVGPLTRTVEDAARVLEVISGYDARDPFAVSEPVPDWQNALLEPVNGMRVLFSPTLGYARPQPHVVAAAEAAAKKFEAAGAKVIYRDDLFEEDPVDLWNAEFYAGVGTKLKTALDGDRGALDPSVAALLDAAVSQQMRDYYAKVFDRYDFREKLRAMFDDIDLLLSPTLPVSAVPAGHDVPEGYEDRNVVSWVYYTYPFNLTGQPAVSVPFGTDELGMPIGVQLVGRLNDEATVLRGAAALEATNVAAGAQPDLAHLLLQASTQSSSPPLST